MKTLPSIFYLGCLSLLTACGGGSSGGSVSCEPLEPWPFVEASLHGDRVYLDSYNPEGGEAVSKELFIILPSTNVLNPVTHELGTGEEANTATCKHCVRMGTREAASNVQKMYFADRGQLDLGSMLYSEEEDTVYTSGTIQNVRLIEITIVPATQISTPVKNGTCYEIASAHWNFPTD